MATKTPTKTPPKTGESPTAQRQSGKARAIAFLRVFIGTMWIFEITVGHNWKIGGLGSGAHEGWVGAGAGDQIREYVETAVADGTWAWAAWFMESVVAPNAVLFSYVTVIAQVLFGVFLIAGFAVRPTAVVALTFDLFIMMFGNSRIPPFFTAAHLFVLFTGAGQYYGVDGWLRVKLHGVKNGAARLGGWLIDLPIRLSPGLQNAVLASTALFSVYFLMNVAMRETPRMNMVAMDIGIILLIVTLGLIAKRFTQDHLAIVIAGLQVFIGYKFLHEIWVRTGAGNNGLPGWAPVDAQRELFEKLSDNHYGVVSAVIDSAVLPILGFWVIVFGVVQFAVGAALIVGYRTRLAASVGLVYLAVLIPLGFNRYAPFVMGLLIVAWALDGRRVLGVDAARDSDRTLDLPLPSRRQPLLVVTVLVAVVAVALVIAVFATGGITPDAYIDDLGAMTAALVAIITGPLAVAGWLKLRETVTA
ncbi:MAG: hypothetical protein CVT64_02175 [Actinobacteria bacterium HGW-Actinobacteria-4]|nr:MAG: hypothetical protein CVT64_02175 [Actinobacteria bacterium HGW-Actinobacteria-4]